jgi:predicted RNA binding protein YcfA (HicA-like mRNA interferase family)
MPYLPLVKSEEVFEDLKNQGIVDECPSMKFLIMIKKKLRTTKDETVAAVIKTMEQFGWIKEERQGVLTIYYWEKEHGIKRKKSGPENEAARIDEINRIAAGDNDGKDS